MKALIALCLAFSIVAADAAANEPPPAEAYRSPASRGVESDTIRIRPRASDDAMEAEVGAVLDSLHASAASADAGTYFSLFTPEATYVGTAVEEVWTLDEFRRYAAPIFASGRGWTYRPVRRSVHVSLLGGLAWFEEVLEHDTYGAVRGSGVLQYMSEGWRIEQYVLSFPVPNEIAGEVTARIRAADGR